MIRRGASSPPPRLAADSWLLAGLAWEAAVVILDALAGRDISFFGILVGGPFVAAAGTTMRRTATTGVLALVCGAVLSFDNDVPTSAAAVRLGAVAVGTIIAVWVADVRVRREQRLTDVSHVVSVAQSALLRPVPHAIGGWRFGAHYEAAGDLGVGGDLYDVALTPSGAVLAIVADVQGKGVGAVADAGRVLAAFRRGAFSAGSLGELAAMLDAAVNAGPAEDDKDETFATALLCRFSGDGRLEVANFGHPGPFVVRGGRATILDRGDHQLPLGMSPALVIETATLGPGDALVCFTDGLIEARNAGGEYHDPLPAIAAVAVDALDASVAGMGRGARTFAVGRPSDDLTVFAAAWVGVPD